MDIEKKLSEIAELMKTKNGGEGLSGSDLTAFVEDRLDSRKEAEFIRKLSDDPSLLKETLQLKILVSEQPLKTPPAHLHKQLMRRLGLESSHLMEIVLKKSREMMDVLTGKEYLFQGDPALLAVRGEEENDLIFKTEKLPYYILCHVDPSEDNPALYFSLETIDSKRVKNGRFILRKGNKKIFEIVTDKMGVTSPCQVDSGDYEIDVEINREFLGTIKLNIF